VTGNVALVAVKASERDEFMRVAEQHFRGLSDTFTPHADWKESYLPAILANPQMFLRWIVSGGQRSGFILYGIEPHRFLPRKTGAIYELFVSPEKRRQGLAREAATLALSELWALGPSKIQLEVVDGNAGAGALWKSLGFTKATERYVLPAKP